MCNSPYVALSKAKNDKTLKKLHIIFDYLTGEVVEMKNESMNHFFQQSCMFVDRNSRNRFAFNVLLLYLPE